MYVVMRTGPSLVNQLRGQLEYERRLDRLQSCLEHLEKEWKANRRFPICLAGANGKQAQQDVSQGRVHCVVWCDVGYEEQSESPEALCSLCTAIEATPMHVRPRVAFVAMQYGARRAAEALHASGVDRVFWLRTSAGHDRLEDYLCGLMAPVLSAMHTSTPSDEHRATVQLFDKLRCEFKHDIVDAGWLGTEAVEWTPPAWDLDQFVQRVRAMLGYITHGIDPNYAKKENTFLRGA